MEPQARDAGVVLTRVALAAALWLVLGTALGGLLAAAGWWSTPAAIVAALVAAAASAVLLRGTAGVAMPAAPALVLVAVVLGILGWAGATHSEQVLVRRDAASNLQASLLLERTGQRIVSVDANTVGGPALLESGDVTLESPAFYQVGTAQDPAIEPQFLLGPAVNYGLAFGVAGLTGAFLAPAVAMALALLLLGLLVARVVGPWWSVPTALLTGLLFPFLHTARATYSEPLALATLAGGALALTLATGTPRWSAPVGRWALVAGLLVGGTGLIRLDAPREVLALLPGLCLLAVLRPRTTRMLLVGILSSLAVSVAFALSLSGRYLEDNKASVVPLMALLALGCLVAVAAVAGWCQAWRRGWRPPPSLVRRLPDAVAASVVFVALYLASRPLWQVGHGVANSYVASMQRSLGLPADATRTYAEQSVDWLSWYVGPLALVGATATLTVLLRDGVRLLTRGRLPAWLPVLLMAAGSSVLTLLRPGITPDHPWADRRLLVPLALVVVLVVVAAAWASAGLRRAGRPALAAMASGAILAATAVPALAATWPHRAGGMERGSLAATAQLCDRLGPDDVVLAMDFRSSGEWLPVVRGRCGVPAAAVSRPVSGDPVALRATVAAMKTAVAADGHRLVLISASSAAPFESLGLTPDKVVDTSVAQDEHALTEPPDGSEPLDINLWLATP